MIPIIKASRQQFTLIILHFSFFLYEIFQFVKLDRRKTAFLEAVKNLYVYKKTYKKDTK